jgi:hypothetical protein
VYNDLTINEESIVIMANDIITQIMVDSDLIILIDYSYAEANEIDVNTLLRNFVDQIITEIEPVINDQDKMKQIRTLLDL